MEAERSDQTAQSVILLRDHFPLRKYGSSYFSHVQDFVEKTCAVNENQKL